MKALFSRRRSRLPVLVVAGLAVAGGVAYATIPGSGNVYTACMLNHIGTIRLIDPSLPASSLMSHCTSLETQIIWNQQGQKGDPGLPGPAGRNGTDGVNGVSPTVAQVSPGDSHCPSGGAAITDAAGTTAYVCSGQNGQDGQNGKDGQPFSGTFTSPNKQFSLTVADGGVEITGPDATVSLPSSGGVAIKSTGNVSIQGNNVDTSANNENISVQGNRTEAVGQDETISVGRDRTVTVGRDETIAVHRDRTETVDRNQALTIHGNRTETVDNDENVTIGANRTENVGSNEALRISGSRSETVGAGETVLIGSNRTETVGGALGLRASGSVSLDGGNITINGGTNCQPAARFGDVVDAALTIVSGSPTVCIGG